MSERSRKWVAYLTIVVPYVALAVGSAAFLGVMDTRADQAELRAKAAEATANLALADQQQSCLDQQRARVDTDEILIDLARELPADLRALVLSKIEARPPIEC